MEKYTDLELMRAIGRRVGAEMIIGRDVDVILTLARALFWSRYTDNKVRAVAREVHEIMAAEMLERLRDKE